MVKKFSILRKIIEKLTIMKMHENLVNKRLLDFSC